MASKYKPRRPGKQSVHNQTARVRDERDEAARAANPASNVRFNDGESQARRAIDLATGRITDELPVQGVSERRREIPTTRRVGNWEVGVDDDKLRVTRRFKHGGVVKKPRKRR